MSAALSLPVTQPATVGRSDQPLRGGHAAASGHQHRRRPSAEGVLQVVIMLAIGGAAGAGSFTHVHDVAATHGQAGWLAWADAVVLELMSIASGLELRRRKRGHESAWFPAAVMAVSVVLSLGAQVIEAEPSVIGWIAAAIPALGFLVMVKIALARAGTVRPAQVTAAPDVVAAPVTAPVSEAGDGQSRPGPDPAGDGSDPKPADPAGDGVDPVVVVLIPAARAAAQTLHEQGRRVTRTALAEVLRAEGLGVSNARASALLRELKPELAAIITPTGLPGVSPSDAHLNALSPTT